MKQLIQAYRQEWFFYVFMLKNLSSILEYGILPKNQVESLNMEYTSFAYDTVQERRHHRHVCLSSGNWVNVHDLVPVYLTPRTPTLFAKLSLKDSMCFAVIDSRIVLDSHIEFAFTDGNAGSEQTIFYNTPQELCHIPWDVVKAQYWNTFEDGVRQRNAEFLIYPSIELQYIKWFVVSNPYEVQHIEDALYSRGIHHIQTDFDTWYFFG